MFVRGMKIYAVVLFCLTSCLFTPIQAYSPPTYPCASQYLGASSVWDAPTLFINSDGLLVCNQGTNGGNDCLRVRYRLRVVLNDGGGTVVFNSGWYLNDKPGCGSTDNPHVYVNMATYGPGSYRTIWEGYRAVYDYQYHDYYNGTQLWSVGTYFSF